LERPELEVEVSDFETMAQILERLGFRLADRMEKRRETWHVGPVIVALDELEFGSFVEIEGDPTATRALAEQLGLDLTQALPQSYRQLRKRRSPKS
jgi:predicted adenylyl cyclase CyaB